MALVAVVVGCAACTGETLGPATGALEVTASVAGDGSDPDGFLVVVNRMIQRSLMPGEPVLLSAIAPGEYEVVLEGIGPNCSTVAPPLQPATVVAGDTTRVAFEVTCNPAAGMLRLTVRTTGSDLDPSGYDVLLDGELVALVEPEDALVFTVAAGNRTLTLGAVNPNCEIAAPASRSLAVPIGGLASADFEIQCAPTVRAGRGREIAYTREDDLGQRSIHVVNDDGSHTERLLPTITGSHGTAAWAPDGNRVAFYAEMTTDPPVPVDSPVVALTVTDVATGQSSEFPQPLLLRSAGIGWSPDGTRLALGGISLEECPRIRLFDLAGSKEQPLDVGCYTGATFESLSWSPDGRQIAFIATVVDAPPPTPPPPESGLRARLVELDTGTLGIADLAVPGQSSPPGGCAFQNAHSVSWSPDGTRLAVAAGGIFVLDLGAAICTRLTDDESDVSPSWAPDGGRIAFSSARDGNPEIYVMQADGSGLTRITRNTSDDVGPSWRP